MEVDTATAMMRLLADCVVASAAGATAAAALASSLGVASPFVEAATSAAAPAAACAAVTAAASAAVANGGAAADSDMPSIGPCMSTGPASSSTCIGSIAAAAAAAGCGQGPGRVVGCGAADDGRGMGPLVSHCMLPLSLPRVLHHRWRSPLRVTAAKVSWD